MSSRLPGAGAGSGVAAIDELAARGVENVIVSRAGDSVLARLGRIVVEVTGPQLTPMEPRGAGDSMTAGIAAGIARGESIPEALRLGAAAGAMNVTRRGLATGDRSAIELFLQHIMLRPFDSGSDRHATVDDGSTTTLAELAARSRSVR